MTVREVAEYLKVKERTVYRLVAASDIPAFKVGEFLAIQEGRNRPMDRSTRSRAGMTRWIAAER